MANETGSSDDDATIGHILRVTFFIQAFAIILFNLLTIITFATNRHVRKRDVYCVINLALADMLFGVDILRSALSWKTKSGKIYLFLKHGSNSNPESWPDILHVLSVTVTMCSLALTALERMGTVVWPLCHRATRYWVFTLATPWTVAAISALLTAISIYTTADHTTLNKIVGFIRGPAMFLLVVVICVSYIVIFIKIKKQKQQMGGQRVPRVDKRVVMTLFIVTVVSIGTWIPLAVYSLLTAKKIIIARHDVLGGVISLAVCNSLVNPIIYVFRMKGFRKALLRLMFTCSRDRPIRVEPRRNLQLLQIVSRDCFQEENQRPNLGSCPVVLDSNNRSDFV